MFLENGSKSFVEEGVKVMNIIFFYNGNFVTNEIFSESKFVKFLEEKGL